MRPRLASAALDDQDVIVALVLGVVALVSGAVLLGCHHRGLERRDTERAGRSFPDSLGGGGILPRRERERRDRSIRGTTDLIHAEDLESAARRRAAVAFAIMAAVSLVLGWPMAGRFLRPLRTITATTREISATNLHERLNLAGPEDELKELADTFDQLLDRLERSFSFERRFVAKASARSCARHWPQCAPHSMSRMAKPTPAPAHISAPAERLRRELDHADRLLESFLTLAHAQQAALNDATTVSLTEFARVAVEHHAAAISQVRLEVTQEQDRDVWVSGSKTLLSRMVENVIDNAIVHNEPDGWPRVSAQAEDAHARFVVENGGTAA